MAESEDEFEVEPDLRSAINASLVGLIPAAISKVRGDEAAIFSSERNGFFCVLTSEVNCSVVLSNDLHRFDLVLNIGLAKFYKEMTRMFCTRIELVSESEWKSRAAAQSDSEISFEETVEVAKVLMEAFWRKEILTPDIIPKYELEETYERLHKISVTQGIRFATAHEFGHVILAVSPSNARYRLDGERVAEHLLQQVPNLSDKTRDKTIQKWGQEFAADRIGLELSLEAEKTPALKVFQLSAAEWFFVMGNMLWHYYTKTCDKSVNVLGTHPPFHIRLEHLRKVGGSSTLPHDPGFYFKILADDILAAL